MSTLDSPFIKSREDLLAALARMREIPKGFGGGSLGFLEGWIFGVEQTTEFFRSRDVTRWWVATHGSPGGPPWTERVAVFVVPDYYERRRAGAELTSEDAGRIHRATIDALTAYLVAEPPPRTARDLRG